jgi:hypothetical protein
MAFVVIKSLTRSMQKFGTSNDQFQFNVNDSTNLGFVHSLHTSGYDGDVASLLLLLQRPGIDVNPVMQYDRTWFNASVYGKGTFTHRLETIPLTLAAFGQYDTFRILLTHGGDIGFVDRHNVKFVFAVSVDARRAYSLDDSGGFTSASSNVFEIDRLCDWHVSPDVRLARRQVHEEQCRAHGVQVWRRRLSRRAAQHVSRRIAGVPLARHARTDRGWRLVGRLLGRWHHAAPAGLRLRSSAHHASAVQARLCGDARLQTAPRRAQQQLRALAGRVSQAVSHQSSRRRR